MLIASVDAVQEIEHKRGSATKLTIFPAKFFDKVVAGLGERFSHELAQACDTIGLQLGRELGANAARKPIAALRIFQSHNFAALCFKTINLLKTDYSEFCGGDISAVGRETQRFEVRITCSSEIKHA